MQHLYAAGFNAWNQLAFKEESSIVQEKAAPEDLRTFTKVLEGNKIKRPTAQLSFTIVEKDGVSVASGIGHELFSAKLENVTSLAKSATGVVLTMPKESSNLQQFPSLAAAALNPEAPNATWECKSAADQIVAFNTGFAIRFKDGSVQTLGDPRYEDCLGREVFLECPAETPQHVKDLDTIDDRIVHLTAGGYAVAALTAGGSLYTWGRPGFGSRDCKALPDLNGIPNYIEVDGDKDVKDAAFGDTHAIALTTDGLVYVIGENPNGQLGVDSTTTQLGAWTRLDFEPPAGHEIVAVAAGPKSSFVITAES